MGKNARSEVTVLTHAKAMDIGAMEELALENVFKQRNPAQNTRTIQERSDSLCNLIRKNAFVIYDEKPLLTTHCRSASQ